MKEKNNEIKTFNDRKRNYEKEMNEKIRMIGQMQSYIDNLKNNLKDVDNEKNQLVSMFNMSNIQRLNVEEKLKKTEERLKKCEIRPIRDCSSTNNEEKKDV